MKVDNRDYELRIEMYKQIIKKLERKLEISHRANKHFLDRLVNLCYEIDEYNKGE